MIKKVKPVLFMAIILSIKTINAMEIFSTMTIENQLNCPLYLNVPNPDLLTDQSPYPFIKAKKTQTFLLTPQEKTDQSIAFPSHVPNKILLPINAKETHFIIKNDPFDRNKIIVNDNFNKIISELIVLSNSQNK